MNTEQNYPCPLKSEETIELWLDYTAHRLDSIQVEALERHMSTCGECEAFRTEHAAVWMALDEWEPAPVSTDFNRKLWQRIEEEKAAPWYSKSGLRNLAGQVKAGLTGSAGSRAGLGFSWKPAVPLAAAVLVVAAGFLMDHTSRSVIAPGASSAPATESRVTVSEAEQVERTLDDIQLLHEFDISAAEAKPAARTM